jgi:cytochrome c-type biogenesis protein CcmH
MTELWLGLAVLLLPLAFFVAWPLLSPVLGGARRGHSVETAPALASLYREHLAELDATLASGAIDSEQYAALQAELARNLLSAQGQSSQNSQAQSQPRAGRGLLLALSLGLPLLALGLYFHWGAQDELALYRDILASQQGMPDRALETSITERLRARALSHPEDVTSRYVLAQRLLMSGDLAGAVESYRFVVEREPQAPVIKAELAQALFFANGSRINGEVRGLVEQVLDLSPDNGTALGLAGIAAFDRADYRAARSYWQRALDLLPENSQASQALAAGVARAEVELGKTTVLTQGGDAVVETPEAVAAGPAIRIQVALADAVSAAPDTPVFVYARTADSPMPLAIVKLTAAQLPAEVVLDESRAMMPGRSLANAQQVQLVARLALHGDARPAPGDWQGQLDALPKSDWGRPVSITIDREL